MVPTDDRKSIWFAIVKDLLEKKRYRVSKKCEKLLNIHIFQALTVMSKVNIKEYKSNNIKRRFNFLHLK